MVRDFRKSDPVDQSALPRGVSDERIGAAYRRLAQEHVELRAGTTPQARKVIAENIWAKIEAHPGTMEESGQAGAASQTQKTGSRRAWVAAMAACAAAALGGWYVSAQVHPPKDTAFEGVADARGRVSFEVDGTTVGPEVAGQGRLIASEGAPVGIRLSDRSEINLQPHTTVRVAALSDGVVITRMSQGAIDVDVVHQEHTNYQFFAGPYLVKVVGTAFRLSYEPEEETFELKMRTGVVEVLGPDGASQTVKGGESLHLEGGDKQSSEEVDAAAPESASSEQAAGVLEPAGPSSAGRPTNFHALAAQGNFREIVTIAEARGISQLLTSAPADQLQELAQAARYSGQLDLAERVWTRMASRFSSSVTGKNAVFFLGRLDEQRGRQTSALSRYESYLRISPRGVYAQEAWGRKLQLTQQSAGHQATRAVAEQYVERFPKGPYAETARRIIAGGDP